MNTQELESAIRTKLLQELLEAPTIAATADALQNLRAFDDNQRANVDFLDLVKYEAAKYAIAQAPEPNVKPDWKEQHATNTQNLEGQQAWEKRMAALSAGYMKPPQGLANQPQENTKDT